MLLTADFNYYSIHIKHDIQKKHSFDDKIFFIQIFLLKYHIL